jgi:hypothetical protein
MHAEPTSNIQNLNMSEPAHHATARRNRPMQHAAGCISLKQSAAHFVNAALPYGFAPTGLSGVVAAANCYL